MDWRAAIGTIVGLFVAGAISLIAATNYVEDRQDEAHKKYCTSDRCTAIETQTKQITKNQDRLIQNQTEMLEAIIRVETKLDQIQ